MTTTATTTTDPIVQQTIFNIHLAVTPAALPLSPIEATKKHVAGMLREAGYRVMLAPRNRAYVWYTDGERVAGIEVRRAVSSKAKEGQYTRYQVPINGHDQAQVVLLLAITPDDREYPFFIPMAKIGRRVNISVWAPDPAEYNGQWAPYRNNWDVLTQALDAAPANQGWGLTLFK